MSMFDKKKKSGNDRGLAANEAAKKPAEIKSPKAKVGKKIGLAAAVLISLALVAGSAAVYLKRKPAGCEGDTQLIASYNTTVRQGGVTKLGKLSDQIQKKAYQNDATCVYMLMVAQYGAQNTVQETAMYQKLNSLQAGGKKVSPKINDGINRDMLNKIIQQQQQESGKHYVGQG